MSARSQITIGAIAVAVAAGLIALVMMLRKDPKPSDAPRPGSAAGAPGAGAVPVDPTAARPPPVLPRRAGSGSTAPSGEPDSTDAELTDEQIAARDHRGGDTVPSANTGEFIRPQPKQVYKMRTDTVLMMRKAVRPVVMKCAESLPAEARGAEPRLQGEIIVTVQGDRIMVDEAKFQYRDIAEEAREPLAECVRKDVEMFDFPLPPPGDDAPVNQFTLTFPFNL